MVLKRKLFRGAAALVVTASVAACSSSSKASSSSSSGQSQSTAGSSQPAGAPIKVGVICTCSGPFGATILAAEDTYKAWANSVNASGGLAGHPIQLTTEDDSANPGTSTTDAQTLISDHVDAIVDLSVVDQTWASAVQAANIPVVGADETEVPFYTNPDFYPPGQTNDSVTYANAATAKAAGATNMADFYCAEAPSCQQGVPLIRAAGQKVGVPDVYDAEIAATAPNYTAQCVAAQQKHVTALFIGDSSTVIARVGTDCSQQGYNPIYITEGEGFAMNLAQAPGIKENLWSEYSQVPFFSNIPAIQAMNAAVDKYYPGLRNNVNEWSQIAVEAWSSGLLLRDAVKASGLTSAEAPTSASIVKGLDSLKNDTLDGTAPPLTFTAGQPHPVDCWFTGRVSNGTTSVVNGGKVTCENGSSTSSS